MSEIVAQHRIIDTSQRRAMRQCLSIHDDRLDPTNVDETQVRLYLTGSSCQIKGVDHT